MDAIIDLKLKLPLEWFCWSLRFASCVDIVSHMSFL